MICISCKSEHYDKFCPNCGENSGVKKITFSSILEDAFSTITNMDRGFLFNIKALTINPRKLTSDYIRGKRKGILNPISFLIISITIYLIVESLFKLPHMQIEHTFQDAYFKEGYSIGENAGKIIKAYFKYFLIFSIFPLASSTKMVFNKYNYLEHLAISSFIIGMAASAGTIPYLLFKFLLLINPVLYIVIFLLIYRIFKDERKIASLLLSFTSLFLFIVQLFIILLIIGLTVSYVSLM